MDTSEPSEYKGHVYSDQLKLRMHTMEISLKGGPLTGVQIS